MKTKECTVYICEHCGQQYKDLKTVTRCQERCSKQKEQRQQWFKANPPKYKVGDILYSPPSGLTLCIESISKHSRSKCWKYYGSDEDGLSTWISSQTAQLLLSRQEADSRKRELRDRLQDYAIGKISFVAHGKNTAKGLKTEVETQITLKDKDYTWKR